MLAVCLINEYWVSITRQHTHTLGLSNGTFSSRFGLFEAMSAIEMMDPKMDAGMIGNQVNRKVLSFEQAVKVWL